MLNSVSVHLVKHGCTVRQYKRNAFTHSACLLYQITLRLFIQRAELSGLQATRRKSYSSTNSQVTQLTHGSLRSSRPMVGYVLPANLQFIITCSELSLYNL